MAEGRMTDRVKGLLAGSPPGPDPWAHAAPPLVDPVPPQMASPEQAMAPGRRASSAGAGESHAERQALQVLMLARRTGDEYVALANRHADATRAEARTSAEQIAREAQDTADRVRRDADRMLAEAQARSARIVHDAQVAADDLRTEVERERAEARSSVDQMIEAARARAAELEREAEERYAAAIDRLAGERASLQQQIEALHQFDREYRDRLRVFMQGQLRSLDEGKPAAGDLPPPGAVPTGGLEQP